MNTQKLCFVHPIIPQYEKAQGTYFQKVARDVLGVLSSYIPYDLEKALAEPCLEPARVRHLLQELKIPDQDPEFKCIGTMCLDLNLLAPLIGTLSRATSRFDLQQPRAFNTLKSYVESFLFFPYKITDFPTIEGFPLKSSIELSENKQSIYISVIRNESSGCLILSRDCLGLSLQSYYDYNDKLYYYPHESVLIPNMQQIRKLIASGSMRLDGNFYKLEDKSNLFPALTASE